MNIGWMATILVGTALTAWGSTPSPAPAERFKVIVWGQIPEGDPQQTLTQRATAMVIQHMGELRRFDVIDRSQMDKILEEQKLSLSGLIDEAQIIQIGKLAASKIGLVVQGLSMTESPVEVEIRQEKVAQEEKGRHHQTKVEVSQTKIERSVKADLAVSLKYLDIEQGLTPSSVIVRGSATAKDASSAREEAYQKLEDAINFQLRQLFKLNAQIAAIHDGLIQARAGETVGIQPGMLFKVIREESVKRGILEGQLRREIGVVEVRHVTSSAFEASPLMAFEDTKVGDQLVEQVGEEITADLLGVYHPRLAGLRLQADAWIFQPLNFGAYIQGGVAQDSRGESDFVLGAGITGSWKFWRGPRLNFLLNGGLDLYLGSKKDDTGQSVTALSGGVSIGPAMEFFLDTHLSLIVQGSYHLAGLLSNWAFFEGTNRIPATWTGTTPSVDVNGWHAIAGLKWRIF